MEAGPTERLVQFWNMPVYASLAEFKLDIVEGADVRLVHP
jgi:hypothetical protein